MREGGGVGERRRGGGREGGGGGGEEGERLTATGLCLATSRLRHCTVQLASFCITSDERERERVGGISEGVSEGEGGS